MGSVSNNSEGTAYSCTPHMTISTTAKMKHSGLFPLNQCYWVVLVHIFFSFQQKSFVWYYNRPATDHLSHFSLCPRILQTIVLVPSVLSIKPDNPSRTAGPSVPHTQTLSVDLFGYNYADAVLTSCLQMPFIQSFGAVKQNGLTSPIQQYNDIVLISIIM